LSFSTTAGAVYSVVLTIPAITAGITAVSALLFAGFTAGQASSGFVLESFFSVESLFLLAENKFGTTVFTYQSLIHVLFLLVLDLPAHLSGPPNLTLGKENRWKY
jgi:hypothetical protein